MRDPRQRLIYCGVDLTPFQAPVNRTAVRASLGLPPDAFVLGHVGRFCKPKNHAFLVEIAAEVARREPRARLLLVGEGPSRGAVERQVEAKGLRQRVIFAGVRPDVPDLLRVAMDVFVMPSLFEGLPLVGMEAQAAGLPLVVSKNVTPEVEVLPDLVQALSLAQPPAAWADAVLAFRDKPLAASRAEALNRMLQSPFNIRTGIEKLAEVYGTAVQRAATQS
jgi:glycosyltransferase involved in cell wall biosynthesis